MYSESYINANTAFVNLYNLVNKYGTVIDNTKTIHNVMICLHNPLDNFITKDERKWNEKYAEYEWNWYLSESRSVTELKKRAPIWDKMHNGDDIVNSNYGYQWNRNNQLDNVITKLNNDNNTRQAIITIYDGKEIDTYKNDTPCTLNICFTIINSKLDMTVLMRSNDLWFGFCNDQYCFSKLQQLVANKLGIGIGKYYHFAHNLHIYEMHYDKF